MKEVLLIKNGEIAEKKKLNLPKQVTNVISCKNPRCITQIEQELDQVFHLTDEERHTYRCKYCEEKYQKSKNFPKGKFFYVCIEKNKKMCYNYVQERVKCSCCTNYIYLKYERRCKDEFTDVCSGKI